MSQSEDRIVMFTHICGLCMTVCSQSKSLGGDVLIQMLAVPLRR